MLVGVRVLIVEDEPFIAEAIQWAVIDAGGTPLGPVPTVADALALIGREDIDAAILDVNLADRDVTPVALILCDRGTPFIVHTAAGLPDELKSRHPEVVVVYKPLPEALVVRALMGVVSASPHADRAEHDPNPVLCNEVGEAVR